MSIVRLSGKNKAIGHFCFMAVAESINFDSFFLFFAINSMQCRQHEFVLFCHRLYNNVIEKRTGKRKKLGKILDMVLYLFRAYHYLGKVCNCYY